MFERAHQRLITKEEYRNRLLKSVLLSLILLALSLAIGVVGYHYFANLPWVDSFLNASMILGGMGPVDILKNDSAKIFAGCYALFSGAAFLIGIGVVLTPLMHRFLHKFHIDERDMDKKK